jgi:hypothetical protein
MHNLKTSFQYGNHLKCGTDPSDSLLNYSLQHVWHNCRNRSSNPVLNP